MVIPELMEDRPPLAMPQMDQSLFYRDTIREFDRGPHDPYGNRRYR
jgi:hypothetical protein